MRPRRPPTRGPPSRSGCEFAAVPGRPVRGGGQRAGAEFRRRPDRAVAEFARVPAPGGVGAAYVWDYAEGMAMLRLFWDAAVALDPAAAELTRDAGSRCAGRAAGG